MKYLLLFLATAFYISLQAQSPRIILNENTTDWQNISVLASDPTGDQGPYNIDFQNLWAHNDDNYLFFRLQTGGDVNLQSDNNITLYLDTDDNPNTGQALNGLGVDLEYNFGQKEGAAYVGNNTTTLGQNDIELYSSPTVSANEFEIAISRHLQFFGQDIFTGNSVRILFRNNLFDADQVPDGNGGVAYTLTNDPPDPLPGFSMNKPAASELRILSYNVLFDGLFEPGKQAQFSRIFQALQPDIIGFQEIFDHSSAQAADKLNSWLSLSNGQWHHAQVDPDIIAVSRYPILGSYTIPGTGNGANGAFLIDINPLQLLFIVAHPPCCSNNIERQLEIDAIMAFLRDVKNGSGPLTLPPNSPIVIAGDMNLVGDQQQQQTLLTGDIFNNTLYGPDFNPDWDDTPLEDAKPLTTNLPLSFTWYQPQSSFSPGRLDYITYSGSSMTLDNSFVLFTPALSQQQLTTYNLDLHDVTEASDHLPVVADFDLGVTLSNNNPTNNLLHSMTLSPNPAKQVATLHYTLSEKATIDIFLIDVQGKEVPLLQNEEKPAGNHNLLIRTDSLANGLYGCYLKTATETMVRKLLVVN